MYLKQDACQVEPSSYQFTQTPRLPRQMKASFSFLVESSFLLYWRVSLQRWSTCLPLTHPTSHGHKLSFKSSGPTQWVMEKNHLLASIASSGINWIHAIFVQLFTTCRESGFMNAAYVWHWFGLFIIRHAVTFANYPAMSTPDEGFPASLPIAGRSSRFEPFPLHPLKPN